MKEWISHAVLELWKKGLIKAFDYTDKEDKLRKAAQIISKHHNKETK